MTDNNLTKEDLLAVADENEKKDKVVLIDTVDYLLDQHIDNIFKIRQNYEVKDQDLVSDIILKIPQIPTEKRQQIANLKEKFRVIIEKIAERIEERKYISADKASEDIESLVKRKEYFKLLNAEKKLHISCQTLKVTTEVFEKINRKILEKLENYKDLTNQLEMEKLALANAIIVYELTDFVISYLETFKLKGMKEILAIKENILSDIKIKKLENEELKQRVQQKSNKESVSHLLSNINAREDSYNMIIDEWKKYEEKLNKLINNTDVINEVKENLGLIKDNAKNQIGLLELVEVVKALKGNLDVIESTIVNLEKMELISLSSDRVSILLAPYFK